MFAIGNIVNIKPSKIQLSKINRIVDTSKMQKYMKAAWNG